MCCSLWIFPLWFLAPLIFSLISYNVRWDAVNDFVPGSHYPGSRFCTLCPMKTIRLINGRTYFAPPPLRPCNHLSRTVRCSAGCFIPSVVTGLYSFFPQNKIWSWFRLTWWIRPIQMLSAEWLETIKRSRRRPRNGLTFPTWISLQNILKEMLSFFRVYDQLAIARRLRQTMHHACVHADGQWKRGVFTAAPPLTVVNMCIPGLRGRDGFCSSVTSDIV